MIKKIIIIGLILLVISLAGCAKKEAPPEEKPTATEEAVTNVGSDISSVDALDKDLDTSDLDDIDKELEEINW
ncbi:hypothetical protein J4209_00435 [Candidatus Woesearchaeota archaeon]|nr:hypothetical protein [Candidatus Woesearchaeota archaeon]